MRNAKIPRLILTWGVPFLVAALINYFVNPVLAQLATSKDELSAYISQNDLELGSEVKEGISSVYYVFQGEKKHISKPDRNSHNPQTSGKYIVYVGEVNSVGQVFLYDVLSETTLQITSSSNNLDPKVSWNGWVVWEGWVMEEDGWQVFLYDGVAIKQLTEGDMSLNADIDGTEIVYSRRSSAGDWRAIAYSYAQDKEVEITVGNKARKVTLEDGKIILANGQDQFSLTVESLFLLDKLSGTKKQEIGQHTVVDELMRVNSDNQFLSASSSATIEKPN